MKTETSSPDRILEIGYAFWKSKALLTAIEFDLFTVLAQGPLSLDELIVRLGLAGRGARDFFDALVSLDLLTRDPAERYANSLDADRYLNHASPAYIGAALERLNAGSYQSWGALPTALRTGDPQNTPLGCGYSNLYANEPALETFLNGMMGGVLLPAKVLAENFPWSKYRTVADIGAAQGCCLVQIAQVHRHIIGCGFDLPLVGAVFDRYVRAQNLSDRLRFHAGNFFDDPLPRADVIIMGRILHNWDLQTKKMLLRKAYAALASGGILIVYETLIDDARRHHTHALLQSLNMLIMTEGGFDYTAADCIAWMEESGFREPRVEPLACNHSMIVSVK
jgi:hypothetical protein